MKELNICNCYGVSFLLDDEFVPTLKKHLEDLGFVTYETNTVGSTAVHLGKKMVEYLLKMDSRAQVITTYKNWLYVDLQEIQNMVEKLEQEGF